MDAQWQEVGAAAHGDSQAAGEGVVFGGARIGWALAASPWELCKRGVIADGPGLLRGRSLRVLSGQRTGKQPAPINFIYRASDLLALA